MRTSLLQDGKLFFKGRQYVADDAKRLEVLRTRHDSSLAGHFGVFKTPDLIARDYWWPNMRIFVRDYVISCDTCARSKWPVETCWIAATASDSLDTLGVDLHGLHR
jgi:hypothetical protein